MDYQELNLQKGDLLTADHIRHIEEGIDSVTAEVNKIKTAKIILRNDTKGNWEAVQDEIVLLKGEPAVEFGEDNVPKLKVGDGTTSWKNLPYLATETTGDSTVEVGASDGHLYRICFDAAHTMPVYDANGAELKTVTGSQYIEAPKNLCLHFKDGSARCYLYVYSPDENGVLALNQAVLNLDTDSGKNYLSRSTSQGNLVKDIPSGSYFRVAVTKGSVELYGWDGESFGLELSADSKYPGETSGYVNLNSQGYFGLTIPGSARYIVTKDYILGTLAGISDNGTSKVLSTFNTQFIKLPEGYSHFRLRAKYTNHTIVGHIGGKVSVAGPEHQLAACTGRAARIEANARKICAYEWEPAAALVINENQADNFKPGVIYNGLPYSSLHTEAHFFGWHISPHTFRNAMADPNSVAHLRKTSSEEPYYGTVCSIFATMASGWPYPQTTGGFHYDPQVERYFSPTPAMGAVWANTGHTFIPVSTHRLPEGWAVSSYEGTTPVSARVTRYSHISKKIDTTGWKNAHGDDEFDTYGWVLHHRLATGDLASIPYLNLADTTVIGGYARPHKGDKSVYTDVEKTKVAINIKGGTRLYIEDESGAMVAETDGTPGIPIPSGTTLIDVRSYLPKAGIYYVYTDADPSLKESFEYVTAGTVRYKIENGTLSFESTDFWYAVCTIKGSDIFTDESGAFKPSICYVPGNADLSKWNERGTFGEVRAIFKKATYGAYTVALETM